MQMSMLAAIAFWVQALAFFFIIISILLIIIVLLQKGKGGGLSAAFGGAGGQSAFGSKTGDVFTWATIVIVAVFLLLSMVLSMHYQPIVEADRTAEGITALPPSMPPGQTNTAGPSSAPDEQPAPVQPESSAPPVSDGQADSTGGIPVENQ